MIANIVVTQKAGMPDPESREVSARMRHFPAVVRARKGKYFRVVLSGTDEEEIRRIVTELCEKVFINPVIGALFFYPRFKYLTAAF